MGERRGPGARLLTVLVLVGVLGLAAPAVPWIWGLPERLHPPLTEAELRGLAPDQRLQRQQEQRKLQNDVRSALIQGLVGVLALTGAAIGASIAWRQLQENRRHQQHSEELGREELRLTRDSQIADRFTRAVEQLGNKAALDVRLGGIYALERLAHDSPEREHPTVVEVLSAFVREGSQRPHTPPPEHQPTQETADQPDAAAARTDAKPRPATDIQAALTVIGRLPQQPHVPRGDLSNAQLAGARLGGANLAGAKLNGTNLAGAQLNGANLAGAELREANLAGAQLFHAKLAGAQLYKADLSGAWLERADLTHAGLHKANLTEANLIAASLEAGLSEARLNGANLSGAQLDAASLPGARLTRANLAGAELREANLAGATLSGANLAGTQLYKADLSGAWLVEADLSGAWLVEADLKEAHGLTQAQLDSASGNAATRIPDRLQRPTSWATGEESAPAGS